MARAGGRSARAVTVSIRELRAGDDTWLDTWLGACAASVRYDVITSDAPSASLHTATERDLTAKIIVAAEPVGVITYRLDSPSQNDAIIEFVGIEPSFARRGHGQAGASLLEAELRAAGVRRIFAPAPEAHGIAMYFWIRLGYRPLLRGEWPCTRDAVAWLARDLVANGMGSGSPASRRR